MRSTGNVSGKVYNGYLRAGGNWCVLFVVIMLCVLTQLAASGGDFFIAEWVGIEEKYYVSLVSYEFIYIVYRISNKRGNVYEMNATKRARIHRYRWVCMYVNP